MKESMKYQAGGRERKIAENRKSKVKNQSVAAKISTGRYPVGSSVAKNKKK